MTNLGLLKFGLNPKISLTTNIWPSQLIEEPIPIVGILTFEDISFAASLSMHSSNRIHVPESSRRKARLMSLFLSLFFFPTILILEKSLNSWVLTPIWEVTLIFLLER